MFYQILKTSLDGNGNSRNLAVYYNSDGTIRSVIFFSGEGHIPPDSAVLLGNDLTLTHRVFFEVKRLPCRVID